MNTESVLPMTIYPETRSSLIVQVKDASNEKAWREFVGLYQPVIYRAAVKKGFQDADAHDLAQQVLISVSGAISRWEQSGAELGSVTGSAASPETPSSACRLTHWEKRGRSNSDEQPGYSQCCGQYGPGFECFFS